MDLHERQLNMAEQMAKVQARARPWKSIIALGLAALAGGISAYAGSNAFPINKPYVKDLVAAGTAVLFTGLAFSSTMGLSGKARELLQPRIGGTHATMVRLVLALVGGLTTLMITLQLFNVPVGQLVLGGALTGVLVGIAAQQTLANLFAGIVLILARPFMVGDEIRLVSGPLGGSFDGTVRDIGLTYVRLEADDGIHVLPNAQVLSAAVGPRPKESEESRGIPDSGAPEGTSLLRHPGT